MNPISNDEYAAVIDEYYATGQSAPFSARRNHPAHVVMLRIRAAYRKALTELMQQPHGASFDDDTDQQRQCQSALHYLKFDAAHFHTKAWHLNRLPTVGRRVLSLVVVKRLGAAGDLEAALLAKAIGAFHSVPYDETKCGPVTVWEWLCSEWMADRSGEFLSLKPHVDQLQRDGLMSYREQIAVGDTKRVKIGERQGLYSPLPDDTRSIRCGGCAAEIRFHIKRAIRSSTSHEICLTEALNRVGIVMHPDEAAYHIRTVR